MYPAQIKEYAAPDTITDALRALACADAGMVCIAGGMSLMQAIKARMVEPHGLLDLQRVRDLHGITWTEEGIRVGAMTRYVELAEASELSGAYSALRDAAARVGDRQVRNRGTIGGSLCWNYVASCMPAAVLGVGAMLELASLDSNGTPTSRFVEIDEFLLGPLETSRRSEELLVSIRLLTKGRNRGSAYRKWGPTTDALPTVGVAVSVMLDRETKCVDARIALTGLPSGATRFPEAEQMLIGYKIKGSNAAAAAFDCVARQVDLQGDSWASEDYKRFLIGKLGQEVTAAAISRANPGANQ